MAVQQLAAGLAQRLPWLGRSHIGALCDALAGLGLDAEGWTAHDLIERLDAHNVLSGRYQPAPSQQRNPLGLLVVQLRRSIDGVQPPVPLRRREATLRTAQRAAAVKAIAAERERLEAQEKDPQAQARIGEAKAAIRAALAAARRRPTMVAT